MTLHRSELLAEPHHQTLEVLCAKALARGDLLAAYRLADRRCKIRPLADPHCFVLRAEALYRMGDHSAAIEDLLEAVHIAPDDVAANRRLLAWGVPRHQVAAARVLIDRERDVHTLRQAIAALRDSGCAAVASLRVYDDFVEGWAGWRGTGPIHVMMEDAAAIIERVLEADRTHPLSSPLGSAVAFQFPRPPGLRSISVLREAEVVEEIRTPVVDAQPMVAARSAPDPDGPSVTVIVPVYADYHATAACLESLLAQLDRCKHRVLVVNDASPDPRILRLLDEMVDDPNIRVITNSSNLGFVGAVNRALAEVPHGDVVLLNSDTIIPVGAIGRLASAAQSSSDIATVTPLSNNGEFTSFPVANRPNVLEEPEIARIDDVAARVNAGRVVDIPNGIGFCLYITRACLDAVGALSYSYHRGYLEDVDFCLRARQHGLRNVCATSVYVAHVGSRSFGREKRSLVVRNLKLLEQHFPRYRAECADFILADPLRPARQAIETCLMGGRSGGVLLVSAADAVAEVARERARCLVGEGVQGVLVLEIQRSPAQIVARLRAPNGCVPQSVDMMLPAEIGELVRMFRRLDLLRVEFFDLARLPLALTEALLGLASTYDVVLAHGELGVKCAPFRTAERSTSNASFWRDIVAGAGCVLVPDAQAEALAKSLVWVPISRLSKDRADQRRYPARVSGPAARIGLVAVRGCLSEQDLMRGIAIELGMLRPELEITVVGVTPDETALMKAGAFVTGVASPAELPQLFERHQLDRLVVCTTRPLFGHPVVEASMATAIPVAYFDWSEGACPPHDGDLALDPSLFGAAIVNSMIPWLGRRILP